MGEAHRQCTFIGTDIPSSQYNAFSLPCLPRTSSIRRPRLWQPNNCPLLKAA